MNLRKNFKSYKSNAQSFHDRSKYSNQGIPNSFQTKPTNIKNYFNSEQFEEELDYLLMNLQMFDAALAIPHIENLNRLDRVNKKIKLVKDSFKHLGKYDSSALGSLFGPKGITISSFLSSYLSIGSSIASVVNRFHHSSIAA